MAAAVAAVAVTAAMVATAAVQIAAAQIVAAVTVRSALKRGGNGGHGGSRGQKNDWREGNQHVAAAATVIVDRRWLWRARTMTAKSISKKGEMKMDTPLYVFELNINFYVRDFRTQHKICDLAYITLCLCVFGYSTGQNY